MAFTPARRLEDAYRVFAAANNKEPNVSELRSAAGVRQQTVAMYLRERCCAEHLDKVPPVSENLKEAFHTIIWLSVWEIAIEQAWAEVQEAVSDHEKNVAAAQAELTTATDERVNAEKVRDGALFKRDTAFAAHEAAIAAQYQAECEAKALASQLATACDEIAELHAQQCATTAEGLAAGLREVLQATKEK